MRINGNCEKLRAKLKERKQLQCRKRFEEAIMYFSRVEDMLKQFNRATELLLETNM